MASYDPSRHSRKYIWNEYVYVVNIEHSLVIILHSFDFIIYAVLLYACRADIDMRNNTEIDRWWNDMVEAVGDSSGVEALSIDPKVYNKDIKKEEEE